MDLEKIELIKEVWKERKHRKYKPRSIVLKLGTNCNLRCDYCYVEHRNQDDSLDIELVQKLFDELMDENDCTVNCCFHGGEPFLYFDKMKEIVTLLSTKPYAQQIKYSCQSNGTLLTEEIVKFINKNGIAIGISIDGPKEVNDMHRKYKNALGSFDEIIAGIKLLLREHISFSVLSVLTNENSGYIIETLDFLKSIGIDSVDLKPCFGTYEYEEGFEAEKYAECMIKVIDWLVRNNTKNTKLLVREIEMYTNLILRKQNIAGWYECRSMCDLLNCGAGREHITLDTDGSVYICDRLYGHKEFVLGNIQSECLDVIMSNSLIQKFLDRQISKIAGCCDCEMNTICFLGCPATNILMNAGDIDAINIKPGYCTYYSKIITKLSEEIKNGNYKKLIKI